MVANRILARFLAIMRRNRRVSSRTPNWPIPGSVTERARLFSPTPIAGRPLLECLLRNRNDFASSVFFLKRGNPTRLPLRLPDRESDHAANARAQSTAASSKLLTHLATPRQSRHHDRGLTRHVHGERPAGVWSFLPRVKCVDQIEPRPRHIGVRVVFALV